MSSVDPVEHRLLVNAGLPPAAATLLADNDYTTPLSDSFIAKAGNLGVANNVSPPGYAIMYSCTLNTIRARVGTAPATTAILLTIRRNGVAIVTGLTIAAAATSGTASALGIVVVPGDVLTVDVTQIGTGTVGADLAIDLSF